MDLTACFSSEICRMKTVALGQAIKRLRTAQGMSQSRLGSLAGFDPNTISRFETGNYPPSVEALYKIAQSLNVSVRDFFVDMENDDEKRSYLFNIICNSSSEELDRLVELVSLPDKKD